MQKNYKNIRSFHNAKIHAHAISIAGKENEYALIQIEAEALCIEPFDGVSKLTDAHAALLYSKLSQLKKSQTEKIKAAVSVPDSPAVTEAGSTPSMTLAQRRTINKLTIYVLKWNIEYSFAKIIETLPNLRQKLTGWELNNSRIGRLYSIMSKTDADKLIKRLTQIERKKK
jgi:hypothetical protein